MTRTVSFFLVGALAGLALASCSHSSTCASNAECGGGQVCLSNGQCAKACFTKTDCPSGQTCTGSGACAPENGACKTNADCGSSQTCTAGKCVSGEAARADGDGTSSGNGNGNGANANPNPSPGNAGGGAPSSGGNPAAGGSSGSGSGTGGSSTPGSTSSALGDGGCGEQITPTVTEANLMIVLDKSSSMNEKLSGSSKWEAAVAAVKQVVTQYPAIHFGLEMFSVPSSGGKTDCVAGAGKIYVPIAPNTQEAIISEMKEADGNGTPIAAGIKVGAADPALLDPSRTEGVVLVTDGEENCNGDPVAEVKALAARPVTVRTWAVGFGSQVNATMLTNMAVAGNTARAGTPKYYQADAPDDLVKALAAIARSATCSFTLTTTPPDPTQLVITIGGQTITRDPTHVSGWDYDPATNRLTLYGAACDAAAGGPNASSSATASASQVGVTFVCGGGSDSGGGSNTGPAADPQPEKKPIDDDLPLP